MGKKPVTIRGVVIATEWDAGGDVITVAVAAHDETEYKVEKSGAGSELLRLIHKEVEVTGTVSERDGKRIIKVTSFSVQKTVVNGAMNREKKERDSASDETRIGYG